MGKLTMITAKVICWTACWRVCGLVAAITMAISSATGAQAWGRDLLLRSYEPLRIALPDFVADSPAEAELARTIPQQIGGDLELTNVFVRTALSTFIVRTLGVDVTPSFTDWRAANTQRLVAGHVSRQPDGRIKVAYRFWDMFGERQLWGSQYLGSRDDMIEIGHMISAEIFEFVMQRQGRSSRP
jgi:TolB protein